MSENQPYEPGQAPQDPNPIDDWRDERRAYRETRRAERHGGAWIWGIFLIVLGLVLLADNAGLFSFRNWWALFILFPAIGAFQSAYNAYRASGGRITGDVRGPAFGGLILTFVAFIFLFNLSFGQLWPFMLVIAGLGLLVNALLPQ